MFEVLLAANLVTPAMLIAFFVGMFVLHFVADFMLQNDEIAKNKSSSNLVLTKHVLLYSLPFFVLYGPLFGFITLAAHWVTDWLSSRAAKMFWERGDRHNFFVVIGADQLMHQLQLIATFILVCGVITAVFVL